MVQAIANTIRAIRPHSRTVSGRKRLHHTCQDPWKPPGCQQSRPVSALRDRQHGRPGHKHDPGEVSGSVPEPHSPHQPRGPGRTQRHRTHRDRGGCQCRAASECQLHHAGGADRWVHGFGTAEPTKIPPAGVGPKRVPSRVRKRQDKAGRRHPLRPENAGERGNKDGPEDRSEKRRLLPEAWRSINQRGPIFVVVLVPLVSKQRPDVGGNGLDLDRTPNLIAEQLFVTCQAGGSRFPTRRRRGREMEQVPDPCCSPVGQCERGSIECPIQAQQQANDEEARNRPHERDQRVRLQHGPYTACLFAPGQGSPGIAAFVYHFGCRRHDHSPTGQPRPLTEIQPRAQIGKLGVETAQPCRQVSSDQHGRRLDIGDVADDVVLFLVDLTLLDAGVRVSEHVRRPPDRHQFLVARSAEQLGSHDRRFCPAPQFRQAIPRRPVGATLPGRESTRSRRWSPTTL